MNTEPIFVIDLLLGGYPAGRGQPAWTLGPIRDAMFAVSESHADTGQYQLWHMPTHCILPGLYPTREAACQAGRELTALLEGDDFWWDYTWPRYDLELRRWQDAHPETLAAMRAAVRQAGVAFAGELKPNGSNGID